METIPNLKKKIAAYLQRQPSDYLVNGFDLLLDAINRAHQYALMQHDFELAKCAVDVPVDLSSGAVFSPAFLHGTTEYVTVKKILNVGFATSNGGVRPIGFVNRKTQVSNAEKNWKNHPFSGLSRYPDANALNIDTIPYLTQIGNRVYMVPSDPLVVGQSPVNCVLDVVRFFPDYIDDDDVTDFILQFGDDFLFWDACCRLNYLNEQWVLRVEGKVGPPKEERQKAWDDLLAWDAGVVNTGDTSFNLD